MKAGKLAIRYVTIASEVRVFAAIITLLLRHKCGWILLVFLAHSRMLLQKLLQFRMAADEPLVIHQRGILAQLFCNFGMAVHEAIHVRQFRSVHITVSHALTRTFPTVV